MILYGPTTENLQAFFTVDHFLGYNGNADGVQKSSDRYINEDDLSMDMKGCSIMSFTLLCQMRPAINKLLRHRQTVYVSKLRYSLKGNQFFSPR